MPAMKRAEDAGSGELLVEALDLRYILDGEAILE